MIHPLLANSLKANALFSGIGGLSLLVFAADLAVWMGAIPPGLLVAVGVTLLVFAVDIGLMGWRHWRLEVTPLVISMDGLWVLASMVLVLVHPQWLSAQGAEVITVVAVGVFTLACLQLHGWLRSAL